MERNAARARVLREALEPYLRSPAGSGVVKLSVSLPADLADAVKAAAEASGSSVSATVAAAVRRALDAADQERLERALALDAADDDAWASASLAVTARQWKDLEW